MKEIVVKEAVEREKGYLYYIDREGNVCRAKMGRGRTKGQLNKKTIKQQKKEEKCF